jgi:hypothetical protein
MMPCDAAGDVAIAAAMVAAGRPAARHTAPGAVRLAVAELGTYAAATARWYALAAWCAMLQTWHDMPGPWWVKVALVAVCLAIPGPQDEILLILLTRVFRAWRARQSASLTTTRPPVERS